MNLPAGREEILFDAARRLPDALARTAFLEAVCAGDAQLRRRLEDLFLEQEVAEAFFGKTPPLESATGASPLVGSDVLGVPSATASQLTPMISRRYKLLQRLGEGGFGEVWMAEQHEPVRRRVALKIIKPGMDTQQVVARFEAERQALAMMDHPNIARVFDGGTTDLGRPYFVMELVRGVRITDYCDENQLSPPERLELFIQVCQAVQHAHQKGVIHRDLKPANILVTVLDGVPVPKVIDFGIAKATQGELTDKTIFTEFKQLIGTPAYMSPEQTEMSGYDIDTRTDIYSLGVLLYELLAGRPPFENRELIASGIDRLRKIIREQEPPRPSHRLGTMTDAERTTTARLRKSEPLALIHLLSGDLDWIVMKCLEKDRRRRYETSSGLSTEIRRYLDNEPVTARPPSAVYLLGKQFRRHKLAFISAIAIGLALFMGIVASTWQAQRARRAEQESRLLAASQASQRAEAERTAMDLRRALYATDIRFAQNEIESGDVGAARHHLDAHKPKLGEEDLRGFEWRYLRSRAQGDETRILGASNSVIWQLTLSPDGKLLAGNSRVWSLETGDVIFRLSPEDSAAIFNPTSNPREYSLLVNGTDGFKRRNLLTGEEWMLAPGERMVSTVFSRSGRWLATGRFLNEHSTPRTGNISLWDTTDWRRVAIVTNVYMDPRHPQALAFSPDEKILVAATDFAIGVEGSVRAFNVPKLDPIRVPLNTVHDASGIEFSPDGQEFYASSWSGNLYVWDAKSLQEIESRRRVGHHRAWFNTLHWIPGSRTLVTASSDRSILLWDVDGNKPELILRGHRRSIFSSIMTSDGKQLFTTSLEEDGSLRQWSLDRAVPPKLVPAPWESHYLLGFSSDGTRVATLTNEMVVIHNTATGQTEPPLPNARQVGIGTLAHNAGFGTGMAAISPDFKWLGTTRAAGPVELRSMTGPDKYILADRAPERAELIFSPDGKLVVFTRATGDAPALVIMELASRHEFASILLSNDWDGVSLPQFAAQSHLLAVPLDGKILLWDTVRRETVREVPTANEELIPGVALGFALSADGRELAIGYNRDGFILEDCETGRLLSGVVPAHLAGIEQLCFSSTGRTLATANSRWLKLWNLATLRIVGEFELPNKITGLYFTQDGNSLLVTIPNAVYLWHAPPLEHLDNLKVRK